MHKQGNCSCAKNYNLYNHRNHIFSQLIFKCESCLESSPNLEFSQNFLIGYYFYLGHSLLVGNSSNYSIKVLLNCIIRYLLTLQSLIPNRKLGASVHLIEQWCYDIDLFAPKSDFCVICLILIYILQYYMMTLNVILLYTK